MLYRFRSLRLTLILVVFAGVFIISGCGDDPPPPVEDVVQEGWDFYSDGDYEEAEAKFEYALELQPGIVDAYVGLGWTYGEMANLQESIANFQNALDIEPTNMDALAGIALAYLANDQYDRAIENANQALTTNPNYSFQHGDVTYCDLRIALAESHYYRGEFEDAQEELAKVDPAAADLDPASEDYAVKLMEILEAASGGC